MTECRFCKYTVKMTPEERLKDLMDEYLDRVGITMPEDMIESVIIDWGYPEIKFRCVTYFTQGGYHEVECRS